MNDIIIRDIFYGGTERRTFTNFLNIEPLIDSNDDRKYFEFIINNCASKEEKLKRIRVPLEFTDDLKDSEIIRKYFLYEVRNIFKIFFFE